MYKNRKTVAFVGHRPGRLPLPSSDLYDEIQAILEDITQRSFGRGYTQFISGMGLGIGLMAAGVVQGFKSIEHEVRLVAAIPYPDHYLPWRKNDQGIYRMILNDCDEITTINTNYRQGVYNDLDQWMVRNCDALVAVWDGQNVGQTWATVEYARKAKKPVFEILLMRTPRGPITHINKRWKLS